MTDALHAVTGARNKLVFVNNGFADGEIQRVIDQVAKPVQQHGDNVLFLNAESDLHNICRTSLRGSSSCIAAAVFYSSPTEGPGGIWNYSIRADGSLGRKIDTKENTNDQEIYVLPIQHAIDFAIAKIDPSVIDDVFPEKVCAEPMESAENANSEQVMEYPFTSITQKERQDRIRIRYMSAIIDVISVALFIGMVGVTYQLTGLIAMERELGMSQLIDCMMPNASRWKAQAARSISAHIALDMIYAPGWIVTGFILKYGVFANSSAGVTVINHVLSGLALSSFSIFGASFFKKAQLSGIVVVIANLLLGVIAQLGGIKSDPAVIVLGLLFPSMNYVFFTIDMARWEKQSLPTNLVQQPPGSPWSVPGIALWILLIVQIIVYPLLAIVVERTLYGTASSSHRTGPIDGSFALTLDGFSKEYTPSLLNRKLGRIFGSKRESVLAVSNLSLNVVKGEIMVLLGANGSGKSTTLDAISGLAKITSGTITVDYGNHGGKLGLCPQKNVLWNTLTVKEHVKIFNGLKSLHDLQEKEHLLQLINDCDLTRKVNVQSRTLSGGQKRKLQLAIMFTGGSTVCCVDEVSSGLDPISRRKIWDILLAERGRRTIIFTTHFLDEAELLADHIAILSKGSLEAQGSTVELKNRLGSGYRVHMPHAPSSRTRLDLTLEGVSKEVHFNEIVYTVQDSSLVPRIVGLLEDHGISDYHISGPTIEDVFLKVAREIADNEPPSDQVVKLENAAKAESSAPGSSQSSDSTPQLLKGKRTGMSRQAWILFLKRATILRRNWFPSLAALLIPVIASGLVTLFLKNASELTCSGPSLFSTPDAQSFGSINNISVVAGPARRISGSAMRHFATAVLGQQRVSADAVSSMSDMFHYVNSLDEFNAYVAYNRSIITPGGFWLGDSSSSPTFAWKADNGLFPLAATTQNILDNFLSNVPIAFQYQAFDIAWQSDVGNLLQLLTYFGLASAVYPAFFALYPTVERLRNVRALHYSNGVRKLPLWLAYLCFDFCTVLLASVVSVVIFRVVTDIWYHAEYLFVVFFLYGLCSTLLAYLISLFAKSQLAAFAITAAMQCVFFLIYFIGYMSVLTYAPTTSVDSYINIVHFTLSIITPVGSLMRAMFVSLNIFSILCRDRHLASYPGEITVYGGPILYLIAQSFIIFGLVIYFDGGGHSMASIRSKSKPEDVEEKEHMDEDVASELRRVASSIDGLRVLHLTKSFKKFTAIEDVTFGVQRGEVFALLGPNGAGKTTTINLIRGDTRPSTRGGEIFVENASVMKDRAIARSHLGVCPQFDAMDQLSVIEHLRFYAGIRGVPDAEHNVDTVIKAVGLASFQHRMAMQLSGGNKRKLSLGIALMGNPAVLLLDEPSSGMDAASKRVMWKTLASVAPGRSIVLTTHSMEEADALANRAGILAKRMLALGSTEYLRAKYGNMYHVHLVHSDSPHTSDTDMARLRDWVEATFTGAVIEQTTYHGQLRFSVPGAPSTLEDHRAKLSADEISSNDGVGHSSTVSKNSVGKLFTCLEGHKFQLGIQFYSVSQTTLDQVFLTIVSRHNIEEENATTQQRSRHGGLLRWRR